MKIFPGIPFLLLWNGLIPNTGKIVVTGLKDINFIISHFKIPLVANGLNKSKTVREWQEFQEFAKMQYANFFNKPQVFWKKVISFRRKKYPKSLFNCRIGYLHFWLKLSCWTLLQYPHASAHWFQIKVQSQYPSKPH